MDQLKEYFDQQPVHSPAYERVRAKMPEHDQHALVKDALTVYRGFPRAYQFFLFAIHEKYHLSEQDMHNLLVSCINNMDPDLRIDLEIHAQSELKHSKSDATDLIQEMQKIQPRTPRFRRPMNQDMRKVISTLDAGQLVDLARDEGMYTISANGNNGLLKRR